MGAAGSATALLNVFAEDSAREILSFLDNSSLITTCHTEAMDPANLNDIEDLDSPLQWMFNDWLQRRLYQGSLEYPDRV